MAHARMTAVHDLASKLTGAQGYAPGAEVTAGTVNSTPVDLQGKNGAIFIVSIGTVNSGAEVNASLFESPDNSGWTEVNATVHPESAITEMDTTDQACEVMSYSHGGARWVLAQLVVTDEAIDLGVGIATF